NNNTIRKITPTGTVSTLAGLAPFSGSTDGTGSEARFYVPGAVVLDGAANVYVADGYNYTIRKITPDGIVSTFAGVAGVSGSAEGTGGAARFFTPLGMGIDGPGNIYVAGAGSGRIRKIAPAAEETSLRG